MHQIKYFLIYHKLYIFKKIFSEISKRNFLENFKLGKKLFFNKYFRNHQRYQNIYMQQSTF